MDGEVERFYRLPRGRRDFVRVRGRLPRQGYARPEPRPCAANWKAPTPGSSKNPVCPKTPAAMRDIKASTTFPIATGERLFTRWGFREAIEARIADVYQPDVCHAGGISELPKIAAMADAHYAQIAPHNPLGPVALAASLQVDCVCDNVLAQELVRDLGADLLEEPFKLIDGMIAAPRRPGAWRQGQLRSCESARRRRQLAYPYSQLPRRLGRQMVRAQYL